MLGKKLISWKAFELSILVQSGWWNACKGEYVGNVCDKCLPAYEGKPVEAFLVLVTK